MSIPRRHPNSRKKWNAQFCTWFFSISNSCQISINWERVRLIFTPKIVQSCIAKGILNSWRQNFSKRAYYSSVFCLNMCASCFFYPKLDNGQSYRATFKNMTGVNVTVSRRLVIQASGASLEVNFVTYWGQHRHSGTRVNRWLWAWVLFYSVGLLRFIYKLTQTLCYLAVKIDVSHIMS